MSKDLLAWCEDLNPLKGNVSQLQATLGLILARAPTVEEYNRLQAALDEPLDHDHKPIESRLRTLIALPQLKVAVRLRTLYTNGNLPFLLTLLRINFKAPKADKFVGYLLDYVPQSTCEGLPDVVKKGVLKRKVKGVAKYIATYPPTLPVIMNTSLRKRVFTHKSYRQISDFLEADSAEEFAHAHNETLVLHGRSLLDVALLRLLDKKFPKAQAEDIELMKRRLSSSVVLTKMAMGYNLSQHLKHNISKELSNEGKVVVLLTVFLAYLGALPSEGYSMDEICLWIEKLYDPIVAEFESEYLHSARPMAYSELRFLLDPHLKFKQCGHDPFTFQAYYKDTVIGVGTHSDKLMARIVALENALADKVLLDALLEPEVECNASEEKHPKEQKEPYSPEQEPPYSPLLEPETTDVNIPAIEQAPRGPQPPIQAAQTPAQNPAQNLPLSPANPAANPVNLVNPPVISLVPLVSPPVSLANSPYAQAGPMFQPPHSALASSLPSSLPAIPLVAPTSKRSPTLPNQPPSLPGVPNVAPNPSGQDTQNSDLVLKNNLQSMLAANNLTPEYHYEEIGSQFKVTITVNGIVLAQCQDSNKSRATRRAIRTSLNTLNQVTSKT